MRGGAAGGAGGPHRHAGGVDGAALRIDDRLAGRIERGGLGASVGSEGIFGQRAAKGLLEPR